MEKAVITAVGFAMGLIALGASAQEPPSPGTGTLGARQQITMPGTQLGHVYKPESSKPQTHFHTNYVLRSLDGLHGGRHSARRGAEVKPATEPNKHRIHVPLRRDFFGARPLRSVYCAAQRSERQFLHEKLPSMVVFNQDRMAIIKWRI